MTPKARIASMIEYSNTLLANSNVDMRYRLVQVQEINLANDGRTDGNALDSLTRSQEVKALRAKYGADLVSLVTKAGPYCGIAWLGHGSNNRLSNYSKNSGYSVVGYNCTGAFPHELGHNLSLGHSARDKTARVDFFPGGVGMASMVVLQLQWLILLLMGHEACLIFLIRKSVNVKVSPVVVDSNRSDGADAARALNAVAKQVADWFPTKVTEY